MPDHDVVILGAGPYGLSAAAHLRSVEGLDVRVFGEPMSSWKQNMPAGMFLRSNLVASRIADPRDSLTLEAFQPENAGQFPNHLPIEQFIEYGMWFQQQAVPDVERKKISVVEPGASGFQIILENGKNLTTRRLVIAAGLGPFAKRPPEFVKLPPALVSHTSEQSDFRVFSGKQVLVVGCGQSGLESAALLRENGAQVEVIGRERHIHWLFGPTSQLLHERLGKGVRNLLYAPTDVGPAGISQLLARPELLRTLPRSLQDRLLKRATRSAGARWLVDRVRGVPIRLGRTVTAVAAAGDQVKIRLDDGSERTVDHVLLATGYNIDISRYEFLAPRLLAAIRRNNGFPKLGPGLESSVSGLHFLGAPAIWSFGPILLFISGTGYACRSLLRHIASARER